MQDIILDAKNVSKSFFFKKILKDINLTVRRGETIAFVGDDGNGKSTLMRILAGLSKPSKGEILVDDKVRFAYIPDKYEMSNLKVRAFLKHMLEIEEKDEPRTIARYCEMLKITDKLDTPMEELTERELHKVAVIQALISEPDILFMDEPLHKQDQESQFYFLQDIKRRRQDGMTIIMACHDYFMLEHLEAKAFRIINGELVDGTSYVEAFMKEQDFFLYYADDDLEDLDFELLEVMKQDEDN